MRLERNVRILIVGCVFAAACLAGFTGEAVANPMHPAQMEQGALTKGSQLQLPERSTFDPDRAQKAHPAHAEPFSRQQQTVAYQSAPHGKLSGVKALAGTKRTAMRNSISKKSPVSSRTATKLAIRNQWSYASYAGYKLGTFKLNRNSRNFRGAKCSGKNRYQIRIDHEWLSGQFKRRLFSACGFAGNKVFKQVDRFNFKSAKDVREYFQDILDGVTRRVLPVLRVDEEDVGSPSSVIGLRRKFEMRFDRIDGSTSIKRITIRGNRMILVRYST